MVGTLLGTITQSGDGGEMVLHGPQQVISAWHCPDVPGRLGGADQRYSSLISRAPRLSLSAKVRSFLLPLLYRP